MAFRGIVIGVVGGSLAWLAIISEGVYIHRNIEGRLLRNEAINMTVDQREAANVASGMLPHTAFSLDDYCGTACRPDSYGWATCLKACRE